MLRFKGKAGFTLIEMLLAVTLFAIVMASAASVINLGLQVWKRTKNASGFERKALLALEKMSQDIRSAVQVRDTSKKFSIQKKTHTEFRGNGTSLMLPILLTADEHNPLSLGGEGRVTYQWDPSKAEICKRVENSSDLFRQSRRVPCRPVAFNVKRLAFRYWLVTGISGSHSWYSQWTNGDEGLPQAVEITVELKPERPDAVPRKFHKVVILPAGGQILEPETV